jgi:hypothetical protein
MLATTTQAPFCADCAYWDKLRVGDGLCRRFAPDVARVAEQIAHWPSTSSQQGCGDGVKGPAKPHVTCGKCVYWRSFRDGIHPVNRSDMPYSWWARSGFCVRRAPRPVTEPGPRAFWRATSDIDYCGEGVSRDGDVVG